VALITQRYIHDEETRLRAGFGAQADAYFAKVPRWIGRA
jgi:protein-S-isoprenylcysteine O-methyltransferase Ste14